MKNKTIFISLFLFLSMKIFCQNYYEISFEGTGINEIEFRHKLFIDTLSNPNNVWQIGHPQKNFFINALSNPNAIVTNTINYYPINDTSSFIIMHKADYGLCIGGHALVYGSYYVNSDSLSDFGKFEFSPDKGLTWIDLINDTTIPANYIHWINFSKPVLTGNSNGWKSFEIDIAGLGHFFNIHLGDTVLWRFTFISDGIQTNKDGLMFDEIEVWDTPPIGIEESVFDNEKINIYPNPSQSTINIEFINDFLQHHIVKIYNKNGSLIDMVYATINNSCFSIDISKYSIGIYFFNLINTDNNKQTWGKFIKQ
jgi:hypothetical protein